MKAYGKTFFLILGLLSSAPAFAESITLQGRVLQADSTPLTSNSVQFRVRILSPDANLCTLYDETQTLDLSASNGLFSIVLNDGTGTQNAPATYSLSQAISNRTAFSVNSTYCGAGAGMVAYTPGNTDDRKVIIYFKDALMATWEQMPTMTLTPSAFAMEARTVGGFPASSLLRVENGGVPGTASTITPTSFTELQNLASGTSTKYMNASTGAGASLPTVAGAPATPAAGSIWFDTGSGTVKFHDGTSTQTLGAGGGGGSVTSVATGAGLTGGPITATGTIALATSGVTAASYGSATQVPVLTVDAYGRITAASLVTVSGTAPGGAAGGDLSGTYPNPAVAKLQGTAVSGTAPTTGNFLKYGGASWGGSNINLADLRSTAGGTPALFPAPACTAAQTLYWSAGTDQFTCQSIGGLPTSAFANIADDTFLANTSGAAGAPGATTISSFLDSAVTSTQGSILYRNGTVWTSLAPGTSGEFLKTQGAGANPIWAAGDGSGTVTSVVAGTGLSGGTITTTGTISMPAVGTAGTYTKITTDAQGRVSAGSGLAAGDIPNLPWSVITSGTPTTLAGYGITDGVKNQAGVPSMTADLEANRPAFGTAGRIFIATDTLKVYRDTGAAWDTLAAPAGTGSVTSVTAGTGLSGGTFTTTGTISMPAVGTAGTYPKVTTDAQGRVTAGAALAAGDIPNLPWSIITSGTPTTLAGYGITDGVKNTAGVPSISADLEANLPAFGTAGRIFIATDTRKVFRDTGTAWDTISTPSTGGTITALTSDVSASGSGSVAATVNSVGGSTAANVNAATVLANAATAANTNSAIVKRDASGNFAASGATLTSVILKDSGSNTLTLQAPTTIANNYVLKFPTDVPVSNGRVLASDTSGNLSWSVLTAGTVTSVAAGTGLSGGTITASGTIALADTAVTPGSYGSATQVATFTVDAQGRLTAAGNTTITGTVPGGSAGGDLSGTYPNPAVAKLQGTAVSGSAPATGNFLKYGGASWGGSNINLADLKSTSGGTPALFPSPACTAAQTLTWSAGTDQFTCQAIGSLPLSANANMADQRILANISGGAAAPAANSLTGILDNILGNTQGSIIYRNGTVWTVLTPGTNGEFLKTQGAGANPVWSPAGGSGTVTSVATGAGLTGGAITSTGTIALADIADNAVLANVSGAAGAPAATTVTTLLDEAIGNTQGNILYRNGTVWTVLAPGTSGQVLKTQGAAANPIWAADDGGSGTVTSVTAGTGLSGGTFTTTGTISMPAVGTAGTYPKVTTDAQGRVTAGAALAAGDIPNLPWSIITSGTPTTLAGYGITDGVKNTAGVPSISADLEANLPAFGTAGRIFIATDSHKILRDTGTAWDTIYAGASGTITALTSDVSASGSGSVAATVNSVGGSTAANVNAATVLANAATAANTNSAIVKRDASGNFAASAATITSVIFKDSGSNTLTLQAPTTIANNYVLKFPTDVPVSNGRVLASDTSGNLSWSVPGAGTVTSITAGTGLSGGAITASGTIALADTAVTPGSYGSATQVATFTVDAQGRLTAAGNTTITGTAPGGSAGGDLSGTYPNPAVAKLQGTAVSGIAPSTGNFLKYGGASWGGSNINLADLKSTSGGTPALFPSPACTAAQTLTWSAGTDQFTCQAIGSLPLSANANMADQRILANISGGAAAPVANTLTGILDNILGNTQGSIIYRNGTVWTVLTPGTSGQVLQTQGAAANPVWATAGGGSGTVTSVATGAGLTGGAITSTGTIALADIADNAVLANVSGAAGAPAATTVTTLLDEAIGNTQGNILYRNGTVWTVLAPGTSGQVLQTQGAAANPVWASAGAADNFGNHIATANVELGANWLSGDGDAEGISIGATGNVGIGTASPVTGTQLDITGTGATASSIIIPRDTTGNRPVTGVNGMLRYNTTNNKFEGYENGAWQSLSASGTGVTADTDALSALTVDFSGINFIRATAASGTCGTLNVTNTTAGQGFTLSIVNATATCTTVQWNGATTNVKLPAGYTGGLAVGGVVYTFLDDGSKLWVTAVNF